MANLFLVTLQLSLKKVSVNKVSVNKVSVNDCNQASKPVNENQDSLSYSQYRLVRTWLKWRRRARTVVFAASK